MSLEAVKASIRDRGDKVRLYSHAELRAMADEIIGPWLVAKAKARAIRKALRSRYFFCTELMLTKDRTMTVQGYARVSSDGQTLDAQQAALIAAGAEKVFAEKISGAVTDRPALGKAIASLEAGDVLVVTKLDRLARPTRDLLNTLARVEVVG